MVDPSGLCSAAMMGAERAVPWKERRLRPSPVAAPVCELLRRPIDAAEPRL
jgi:hypothetical protein